MKSRKNNTTRLGPTFSRTRDQIIIISILGNRRHWHYFDTSCPCDERVLTDLHFSASKAAFRSVKIQSDERWFTSAFKLKVGKYDCRCWEKQHSSLPFCDGKKSLVYNFYFISVGNEHVNC